MGITVTVLAAGGLTAAAAAVDGPLSARNGVVTS